MPRLIEMRQAEPALRRTGRYRRGPFTHTIPFDAEAMPDDRTFAMGKHVATFPDDRLYAPATHVWLSPVDGAADRYRVGLTGYSVRLLNDVYFLDWSVDAGADCGERAEIGEIESSKAVSSLVTPAAGRVVGFNDGVLADPSAVNADLYGAGWLYEFETDATFVDADAYVAALDTAWDRDQRYLKAQANA